MQPTTALVALPRYADWLTTEALARQVGTSSVVVTAWIVTGVKSEAGTIRLRAVKVGGRWRIEPAAVTEFVTATTRAALPKSATASAPADAPPAPVEETVAQRNRRAAECMARLRAQGIATDAVPTRTRRTRTRSE